MYGRGLLDGSEVVPGAEIVDDTCHKKREGADCHVGGTQGGSRPDMPVNKKCYLRKEEKCKEGDDLRASVHRCLLVVLGALCLRPSGDACQQGALNLLGAASAHRDACAVVEGDDILVERHDVGEVDDEAAVAANESVWQLKHEVIEFCIGLELRIPAVDRDLAEVALEIDDCRGVDELLLVAHLDVKHARLLATDRR